MNINYSNKMKATLLFLTLMCSCSSENEHFCTRYQYLYTQLDNKDLLPYTELKSLLLKEIQKNDKPNKKSKMMLLALEDHHIEIIPEGVSSKEFCMSNKRWER